MRPSVRAAFVGFSSPLEGVVPWLYLDVKGLVTVAIGCLVDPVEYAVALPFRHIDGREATEQEVREAWQAVKSRPELAQQGYRVAARYTSVRLSDEGIEQAVMRKLDAFDRAMAKRFAGWADLPADAQLGVLSLCWACGPAFYAPKFEDALRARDFLTCAVECRLREEGNPGLAPRNRANRTLFRNAHRVVADGLDPAALYWPEELPAPSEPDASAARQTGTAEAMREVMSEPRKVRE